MPWNHRVVRRKKKLGIHEAYYDDKDIETPHSITKKPVVLAAADLEQLACKRLWRSPSWSTNSS
jgi:hypothetical protein